MDHTPAPAPPSPEDVLPARQILIQTGIGILVLMGVTFLLGILFEEDLRTLGQSFVSMFGGAGVAVCCALPDAVPMPPPHEVCMSFARLGGLGFWEVVLWATGGSISGGTVGYLIGRSLSDTAWFQERINGQARQAWALIERHGPLALAIGAITPIPYSICCWASGAIRMRPSVFLVVSLLRLPRLALYLWLVQGALVDFPIR